MHATEDEKVQQFPRPFLQSLIFLFVWLRGCEGSLVMYPSVIQIKPSLAIISVARVTIQMTQIAAGSFLAPSSPGIKKE